MAPEDDEERLLRSVALQNVQIILQERQRIERELAAERERLRITLASIGDAVISTDAEGRVVFLNGVAEALTGWPQAEAAGRPLSEIFHIVNEVTRLPVDNPALRALREGRVVDLANHTLLIARDGRERPIDDSAAPMRDDEGATIGAVLVFRDVSERKRAEEAHLRLAAIVESSEDAILSKTLDGIIRSWNVGAGRLFGYTSEEAVGKHITLIIPPDRLEEEATILGRLQRGERIDHFETVRVRKDGRRVDISLTISPLRDHEGTIIGASKIARDITGRKRADAALRESEGRHRVLADLAAATQALVEPGEVMGTAARMLAEHLAVDRCVYAELEDEAVLVVTGEHTRCGLGLLGRWPLAAFGSEYARLMAANEPFVVHDLDRDPRVGADLSAYRQASIRAMIAVPMRQAGKLAATMMVYQAAPRAWTPAEVELVQTVGGRCWESIERTRVGRGLQAAAERLTLALDAARLGDWSWQAGTDRLTLSPRAAEIFGVPPGGPLTARELQALVHEEDRALASLPADRAATGPVLYDVEYRVRRPDGREVWVSARGQVEYAPGGAVRGILGVFQDITEKKHLEQELRQRAEELAEADRKKDDFIALLAHELRNPLAPVSTGLQVMLRARDPAVVSRAGVMMDRQLSHMVRMIDDLLDVSRISRNKLHLQKDRVLLAEVVNHALEVVNSALAAAGHQLHVSLPPEPVMLEGDLTRLAQVFGNILTNSAKYTERGGRIWLEARVEGGEAIVSIRDTGIGIPAPELSRVFDMFSQVGRSVERVTGGLGIGLALVKALVEAHGGKVTAESPGPGAGSTFTVRLQVADAHAGAAAAAPGELAAAGSRLKVVVADDNQDAAASLAELLEMLGNEVHVAHDGAQAVETAERVRPDLVLMDIGMPRADGLTATRRLRERPWAQGVTIIALTGWGQHGDRERTRAAGCDDHLVKPVTLPQLEKLLAALRPARRPDAPAP